MDILNHIYEKPGRVLLIQADHISGEIIGTVMQDLYEAGAFNVQVIPTITKKNRPGYLFIVDAAAGDNCAIENVIVHELGASGWHVIETNHRHVGTDILERDVTFETSQGAFTFTAAVKVFKKQPQRMRPEHASCLAIREALKGKGVHMTLTEISQHIITQLLHPTQTEMPKR